MAAAAADSSHPSSNQPLPLFAGCQYFDGPFIDAKTKNKYEECNVWAAVGPEKVKNGIQTICQAMTDGKARFDDAALDLLWLTLRTLCLHLPVSRFDKFSSFLDAKAHGIASNVWEPEDIRFGLNYGVGLGFEIQQASTQEEADKIIAKRESAGEGVLKLPLPGVIPKPAGGKVTYGTMFSYITPFARAGICELMTQDFVEGAKLIAPNAAVYGVAELQSSAKKHSFIGTIVHRLGLREQYALPDSIIPLPHVPLKPEEYFPKGFKRFEQLHEKYAWYHKPVEVQKVLQEFLDGKYEEVRNPFEEDGSKKASKEQKLDENLDVAARLYNKLRYLHVRPFACYGRSSWPLLAIPDSFIEYAGANMAFDLIGFDLIDVEGREFPLLLETRLWDNADAPGYTLKGGLAARDTGALLADLDCVDDGRLGLTWLPGAAEYFASYTPRQFDEKIFDCYDHDISHNINTHHGDDIWATAWLKERTRKSIALPSGFPSDIHAAKYVSTEVTRLCDAALGIRRFHHTYSCNEYDDISMFTRHHPQTIVQQFTLARLNTIMDSEEMKVKQPSAYAMPIDLRKIICDYAPVDLPFIPLQGDTNAAILTDASGDSITNYDGEDVNGRFTDNKGRPFRFWGLLDEGKLKLKAKKARKEEEEEEEDEEEEEEENEENWYDNYQSDADDDDY